MSVTAIPRNMARACKLYRERNYDEAEKIMAKISEPAHQKAAIQAQLALFSCDFDGAAGFCMEFMPYLNEWYSGNMLDAAFAMLTFCGFKAGRERVLDYFEELGHSFSKDDNDRYSNLMSGAIGRSVNILKSTEYEKKYVPPEKPVSLEDAVSFLREKYRSDLTADTSEGAAYILSRVKQKIDCGEYVRYYERFADSPKLTERTRFDAVEMYVYMDMPEKAVKAVCDFYKYTWLPVEKTTVMPVSIFTYDKNLWNIFTEDMFEFIRKTPSNNFVSAV